MRAPTGSDEPLILVDERNRAVGTGPKAAVHRQGLLHRAFSIFMADDPDASCCSRETRKNTIPAACGRIRAAAIRVRASAP